MPSLRIHDNMDLALNCYMAGGRLERCELWGNAKGGVRVRGVGGFTLAACTLRDHRAAGVYADSDLTVGADCVFARNVGGNVVRGGEEVADLK